MCRTECLLLEKLSNGTPVAVDDILSLLPDAKKYLKWKAEVAPPGPTVRVGEGFQRVGTGKRHRAQLHLLAAILLHLLAAFLPAGRME